MISKFPLDFRYIGFGLLDHYLDINKKYFSYVNVHDGGQSETSWLEIVDSKIPNPEPSVRKYRVPNLQNLLEDGKNMKI